MSGRWDISTLSGLHGHELTRGAEKGARWERADQLMGGAPTGAMKRQSMFGKRLPLSGKGRPKECWQRTKSTPSASVLSTGVPMRVMMPMLATTYGESVTWKQTPELGQPLPRLALALSKTTRHLDAVFRQSRPHGTHTEGNHVHGPTCGDVKSIIVCARLCVHAVHGHTVPAMQPGKRSFLALCQLLSLIQLPS